MSRVTHERPRSSLAAFAAMAGLVVVGGGVAVWAAPTKPEAVARAAPAVAKAVEPSPHVELGVEVTPASAPGLQVSIGGVVSTVRRVPRATQPVLVKVEASGYVAAELKVVPDRDRVVGVTLTPLARAPSANVKRVPAPATPAPPPSGVIRRYPF